MCASLRSRVRLSSDAGSIVMRYQARPVLTLCIALLPIPSSRAIRSMPIPSARSARARAATASDGRPNRFPCAFGCARDGQARRFRRIEPLGMPGPVPAPGPGKHCQPLDDRAGPDHQRALSGQDRPAPAPHRTVMVIRSDMTGLSCGIWVQSPRTSCRVWRPAGRETRASVWPLPK